MAVILPSKAKDARKRERSLRPVRPSRRDRAQYQSGLDDIVRYLKAQTANLSDVIKSDADRLQVAQTLTQLSLQAQARVDAVSASMSRTFVGSVDAANKKATESAIAKAFSVDFATIIDSPFVAGQIELAIAENTALIKSIASEHWSKVGQAVLDNYRGVPLPDGVSLTKRLQDMGGITQRRAKFIARDQTSKLNSALNESRNRENGIEEYIWRTSRDERVVGTPGGKYPKGSRGHENHYKREGKRFRYDNPPEDGHPGMAYNCRCHQESIVDLDKIEAMYV